MYLCISTVVDFNSQNFDPPNEIWQIQPWMNIKKIPPHLAYVATLPSETLMSAKQAINDKLQCSESTSEKINQLRFDRIMVKSLWCHFLAHPCESSTRKKTTVDWGSRSDWPCYHDHTRWDMPWPCHATRLAALWQLMTSQWKPTLTAVNQYSYSTQ